MFQKPEPKHISEIPDEIRGSFIDYIKDYLISSGTYDTLEDLEKEFTIDYCVQEYNEIVLDD